MSFEIKEVNFALMTKELLTNLGFKVIKEMHHIEKGKNQIDLCVKFDSDIFLKPKYAPQDLTFVECRSGKLSGEKEIRNLDLLITAANKKDSYTKRMGGNIKGGILVYNGGGDFIPQSMVDLAMNSEHELYCWDIHRISFQFL